MTGRLRAITRGTAGPLEVCAVVAVVLILWWLILGWDWRTVPTSEAGRERLPQTSLDWVAFVLVAMVAVGWLALRGRAVVGFVGIWVPVVVASAWRLVTGDVLDWPIDLAAFVFALSATCMATAAAAAWARRRWSRLDAAADQIADAADEAPDEHDVEATPPAPDSAEAPDSTDAPEMGGEPKRTGGPEETRPPSPRAEAESGDAQSPDTGGNGDASRPEDAPTE